MRGYRLQQANRIAQKAMRHRTYSYLVKNVGHHEYKHVLGILRKTRKRCSCWMCGNRRKYEGLSIQELRQNE